MATTIKTASPAAVRAFAKEAGIRVGVRGRLNPEAVEAFNKANRAKRVQYKEAAHVETVEVKAFKVNSRGGKTPIRKQVSVPEVRKAALAAGVQVGERGRIAQEVMQAYVAGTLSSLVNG